MRKVYRLWCTCLLLMSSFAAMGQTILQTEGFETDGEGTRYTTNTYNEPSPNCNFFYRCSASPLDVCFGPSNLFTNFQGSFFWGSEDVMRSGTPLPPGQLTLSSVNITGYGSLNVSLFLATANNVTPTNSRWEIADSINVQASINGGAFRTVGRFMGNNAFGGDLVNDLNLNGAADVGEPIVSLAAFTQYTFSIAGTGTSLQIRLDYDQIGGSEELGVDVIQVRGTAVPCTQPTITCPGTQTLPLNSSCQATLPNYTSLATVTGPCSPTVTQSPAIGSTVSGTGSLTVSLFATNTALQSNTCTFTVNKVDNTLPAITCPANVSQTNTVGTCARSVTYTAPTGTDNCSGATTTQTAGLASGASFPVGVTTNTFRVTDGSGNTATCSFTVTVTDNQLPAITCPANQSLNAGVGVCSATATYTAPTGTDNCSGATTTQTAGLASGASFPSGVTTNTFRVTDGSGNTATCSFTVTVTDNQLPSITCPANQSLNAGVGVCTATATYTAPTGTDNCSGATTTQTAGLASGASFPSGVTTNTFRVTDGSGNTATCSFTVTVTDNQLPAITCPANISQSSGPSSCTATVSYTAPTGTDNCTGATTTQTAGLASGATFPAGTTTNTFRVTDGAGNTSTCSFTVTIVDGVAPAITCPSNVSQANATGLCAATVTYNAPNATDNCGTPVASQSAGLPSGSSFPVGVTTNTFMATDGGGNTATCSFTVTITDTEVPALTCPSNATVNQDPGTCQGTISFTLPSATDNCSGATVSQTFGPTNGSAAPVGGHSIILQATDASGNTSTCSFTIDILDTELPSITCPANVLDTADVGACSTIVNYPSPLATDNCAIAQITVMTGSPSGSPFFTGVTTVTLVASDLSSNVSTCSFTVTVVDLEAPTANCQAATVYLDSQGAGSLAASDVDQGSFDGCGPVTLALTPSTFTCSDIGTQTPMLTVTDASGNIAFCLAQVSVLDTVDPTALCTPFALQLTSGSGTIVPQNVDGGSSDNCGTTNLSVVPSTFSTTDIGANTVILTVTDGNGNLSTCSTVVTVSDTAIGIADPRMLGLEVQVAPNPFRDELAVQVHCAGCAVGSVVTVELWSLNGQRLRRETLEAVGGLVRLPAARLAAGTYLLTVTDGSGYVSRRVVKE